MHFKIENTWIPFISVDCTIGHYPNASDDSACIPCEIGFYKDGTGAINCTACPSGFSTVDMGSTNMSNCYGTEISIIIFIHSYSAN